MEELLKLLGLVDESKKAEAQKIIDAVKTQISGLDAKIIETEKLKIDAVSSRDKIKIQLKDIGVKLGINIDTENVVEAIEAIKTKKGVDKVEELAIKQKEIDDLKLEVTGLTKQVADGDKNTKTQMLQMTLKTDVAKILPQFRAKSNAMQYIMDEVEKIAVYEDGKILFKNEDGTTQREGGKDLTIEDVVKSMKQKEIDAKESLFFDIGVQPSGKGGGGADIKTGGYIPKRQR